VSERVVRTTSHFRNKFTGVRRVGALEANAQQKYYLFCFTAAAGHGRIIQMPISSGVCTRRWHSVTADATLSSRSSRVLLLVERRMRGPKASASARVSTPCFELLRENLNEGIRSEAVAGAGEEKKEEGRKKKKKRAENWRCWLMPLKITKKRCCSSAPMQKAHEVVRGVQVRAGQRPAAEERRHLRSRCVATLLRLHKPEVPARAVTQVQLWRGVGGGGGCRT
jgi:hypothetical protein